MSENASPVAPVQNIVHTPGPWVFLPKHDQFDHVFTASRPHRRIASVFGAGEIEDQNTANARLIAAAPEMLELLRRLVHGELPEADDDCTPDSVTLTVSHMDHEDYRHRIRQAKELIARVV